MIWLPILLGSWVETTDSQEVQCTSSYCQEKECFFEEKPFASRVTLSLWYLYDPCACEYEYPEIITLHIHICLHMCV